MFKTMTRIRAIQLWFAAVVVILAAGFVSGVAMTTGTGVLLTAMCLVPPMILMLMWPAVPNQTVAEVLHDAEEKV